MNVFRKKTRFYLIDCILWSVVGVLAVLPLGIVAVEICAGCQFDWITLFIGIVPASLSCLGLFLRWGPTVPCMFLAMLVSFILFNPPVQSGSKEEHVFRELGVPMFGAIFGAFLGLVIESSRLDRPDPKQHDLSGEGAGPTRSDKT
jgi:hypothetical protein